MADAAESTKQIGELEEQLQSMAEAIGKLTKEQAILTTGTEKWRNQTGLLQKQKNKFHKMMSAGFVGALMKTGNTVKNLNKGMADYEMQTEEGKKTLLNSMPAYSGFFVKMMQGTRIQRAMTDVTAGANAMFADQSKIVNRVGMRVTRLATAIGGLFGFLIVAAIGIGLFATAMDGANTPLLSATENMGLLHSAVEGLVFALTGEGEGTFLDVIIAAILISIPLWVILNSTIAAVAFVTILAGGAFQILRNAGVDVKTSIVAVMAIFTGLILIIFNLSSVIGLVTRTGVASIGGGVAAILGAVSLIIGGIALVVAGINRGVTWWKSILMIALGAFLVFIGILILTASLPWAAAIAITIGIIALIVRFWDQIKAITKKFLQGLAILGKMAFDALVAFAGIIITVVLGAVIGFFSLIFGIIGGLIWGYIGVLKNIWKSFWTNIVEGKGGIMGFIMSIPREVAVGFITGFGKAFNAITGIYNKFARKMRFDIPSWVPIVGGKEFKLPEIPEIALAKGGIVKAPTHALIGEAGPEAVIPLNRMKEMGGLGTTINVNIDVSGVTDRSDKRALAREISDLIAQEMRRNGGAPTRGRF